MSTSSGREGFCTRCGHANNEHAHQRDSKCKKCKKGFEICQAGIHIRSHGWKLCFIPCRCGKKYYPDKARAAVSLEPHEYVPGHPGYRPLNPDEDEDTTTIDDSQADAGGAEEPISTPQKGGSGSVAQSGHGRTDSVESEDPLAWSPGTYEQRMGSVAGLVEDLSNTHIEDPGSASTSTVKGSDGDEVSGKEDWCDWYWSAEYGCYARHRKASAATGGWEYEYRSADIAKGEESQSKLGDWSDWYWSAEYKCEARHRENSASGDGWDYEYRPSVETSVTSATSSKSSKKDPKSGKGKGKAK